LVVLFFGCLMQPTFADRPTGMQNRSVDFAYPRDGPCLVDLAAAHCWCFAVAAIDVFLIRTGGSVYFPDRIYCSLQRGFALVAQIAGACSVRFKVACARSNSISISTRLLF
jgi:hypothetical protein